MLHVAAQARGVKEGLSQEVTLALSPKLRQESPLLGCREGTGAQGGGRVGEVGLAPGHWRGSGRVCEQQALVDILRPSPLPGQNHVGQKPGSLVFMSL